MENNVIINSDLEIGLKYIEGLKKYKLVLIDDFNIYLKNKEKFNDLIESSLVVLGTKNDYELIYKEFENNKIKLMKFKGIYMYVIGDITRYLEKEYIINRVDCNDLDISAEKKPFTLYSIDNRYSFLITKLLNLYDVSNLSILDCSNNEDISQPLIFYGHKKDIDMTRISNLTYKTESIYRIYDRKYKKINIY